jgi:hypothetical protein
MRRWLPAAVLLLLVAGTLAQFLTGSSSSRHLTPALAGDAVAIGRSSADDLEGTPIALGMGAGIGDRLDPGMAALLHGAGAGVLRFGDIHADDYDWVSGCSYGDAGQRECSGAAGSAGKLDAFLKFAGQAGAQPLIVLNGEVDNPQQAGALVTYYWQHCVHPAGTRTSCPNPYWEIGDSPANWKHFAVPLPERRPDDAYVIQPDQYAALVVTYAAAMRHALRLINPTIPLQIVADEWIAGATDQSWTADVVAVDTHYAPLLYTPPGPTPTEREILSAVQSDNYQGRPGIDSWLQDLRESMAQFSGTRGIIVGEWSIDANPSVEEPSVYGTYVQALFTAEMLAHFWQDAHPRGQSPLLMAVQYPITGNEQEPFDISTGKARASTAVYTLVGRYFGPHPIGLQEGIDAQRAGIVAAAALVRPGLASLLLVNSNPDRPYDLGLYGLPAGPCEMWWIGPDTTQPTGVGPVHHIRLTGDHVRLPPYAIAVVRAGKG